MLKEFIKNNPKCVRIRPSKYFKSEIEKRLPSQDSIDAFFETKNRWIDVEVKSEYLQNTLLLEGFISE